MAFDLGVLNTAWPFEALQGAVTCRDFLAGVLVSEHLCLLSLVAVEDLTFILVAEWSCGHCCLAGVQGTESLPLGGTGVTIPFLSSCFEKKNKHHFRILVSGCRLALAQWVKTEAWRPVFLPHNHMGGESQLSQVTFGPPHGYHGMYAHTLVHPHGH